MASHAITANPAPVQAPRTFEDALKQGWAVVSDKSDLSIDQKRRKGKLTMQKKGHAGLLQVDYVGTRKGYKFSVPTFAYLGTVQ
jgi:hypothetical protein